MTENLEIKSDKLVLNHDFKTGTLEANGERLGVFSLYPTIYHLTAPFVSEIGADLYRTLVAYSSSLGVEEEFKKIKASDTGDGSNDFATGFLLWCNEKAERGWGKIELNSLNLEERKAEITVENPWELAVFPYSTSINWGCPCLLGKLVGIFSLLFETNCWGDEYLSYNKKVKIYISVAPNQTIESELARLRKEAADAKEKSLRNELDFSLYELRQAHHQLEIYSKSLETQVEDLKTAHQLVTAATLAKDQFLANMSHELRTPLNGVLGMLQLLQDSQLNDSQRDLVTTAKSSAKTLLTLLGDILDISRIEAGRFELHPEIFSINDAIQQVFSIIKLKAEEVGLELISEIDPSLPRFLIGDVDRLRQILLNLLSNAVKCTPKGQIIIRAKLAQLKDDLKALIRFEIEDTGVGIPADKLEEIFKPFVQVDQSKSRKVEGAGLGLSIVSKLVELFGGDLGVSSTINVGSLFWINLPFEISLRAPKSRKSTEMKLHQIAEQVVRLDGLKILLAEDNLVNQKVATKMLASMGCSVQIACNGEEAVKAWREGDFGIILMDIHMPRMDGITATKIIRDEEKIKSKRTPIIALTAHALKGDMERFLAMDMDAYLSKPVSKFDLVNVLLNSIKK